MLGFVVILFYQVGEGIYLMGLQKNLFFTLASTFSLTILAIDRSRIICYEKKKQKKNNNNKAK